MTVGPTSDGFVQHSRRAITKLGKGSAESVIQFEAFESYPDSGPGNAVCMFRDDVWAGLAGMNGAPSYYQGKILGDLEQLGVASGQFCEVQKPGATHFILTMPNPYLDARKGAMLEKLEQAVAIVDARHLAERANR